MGRPCNTAVVVIAIARPKLEGNIAVGDDRQLGFAEFGDPQGRAIFWLHGTPVRDGRSRPRLGSTPRRTTSG
jgi:hypothetical protein